VISQTAEYALRAIVWLASHPEETMSTHQIAVGTRTPAGYLARVMQKLARAGFVSSSPGRTGGFRLARPAAKLSVLEVVNAVDPIHRIDGCPLGIESHRDGLCPLHRRLDEVTAGTERAFRETTISDLLDPRGYGTPLCRPRPRSLNVGRSGTGRGKSSRSGRRSHAHGRPAR
jgi:Rrf2 family protein